ncbi:MAG: hypothetical protein KBE42_02270 [Steroidobacteraceae bacterium]|nr:hypothetical protein [Steroidobacteraceae bacterium]
MTSHRIGTVTSTVLGVMLASHASAAGKPPPPVVVVEFQAPRTIGIFTPPIESQSGWPIVIRASAFNAAGIYGPQFYPEYPLLGSTGFIVLTEPDDCVEILPENSQFRPDQCKDTPTDETFIAFYPDVDVVGAADVTGDPGLRAALGDRPQFNGVIPGDPPQPGLVSVGPAVDAAAGIGYGANDDLPSLVLLSPVGNGLVLNADFSAPAVRTQRNLAGFLNQTSYELRDLVGATSIVATGIVPVGLIAPVMLADDCTGGPPCTGASYRVDGGPVTAGTGVAQDTYPPVFDAMSYELRSFLVSGTALAEYEDLNGDGKVTAQDAKLAGQKVVSNEAVIRLRQFHGTSICVFAPVNVFLRDLDGNGEVFGIDTICPPGPGSVKKPPN